VNHGEDAPLGEWDAQGKVDQGIGGDGFVNTAEKFVQAFTGQT